MPDAWSDHDACVCVRACEEPCTLSLATHPLPSPPIAPLPLPLLLQFRFRLPCPPQGVPDATVHLDTGCPAIVYPKDAEARIAPLRAAGR